MSNSRKPPPAAPSPELQRLVNRLATMVAAELPPKHSITLTVTGPGNPEDAAQSVGATAIRHAKPQLLDVQPTTKREDVP